MSILTRYSEPRHRPPIGRDGRVLVAQPRGILRFNGSAQALVKRVGAIATEALSVKHRVGGGPRVKGLNHEIPAASPAALLPMVRTQVQGAGSWYEEAPTQASPPTRRRPLCRPLPDEQKRPWHRPRDAGMAASPVAAMTMRRGYWCWQSDVVWAGTVRGGAGDVSLHRPCGLQCAAGHECRTHALA